MGKGCVRFKSLEDLALDTRGSASGSGTRQRTRLSYAKREVGAACALLLVQRRSRDNRRRPHRCAPVRGGAHGQLPGGEGTYGQGKKGETKEVILATAQRAGPWFQSLISFFLRNGTPRSAYHSLETGDASYRVERSELNTSR
jgi:hypothetical protein